MYTHIFLRIINATDLITLKAIEKAIEKVETLTDTQRAQLNIVCGMQMQIFLLKENCDLERQTAEKYQALASSYEDIISHMGKVISVTVSPIEEEAEEEN